MTFLFLKRHQCSLFPFDLSSYFHCLYRRAPCVQFSILDNLFGLLFWKNSYMVSSADISTGQLLVTQQSMSETGLFELCPLHERLFGLS